MKKVISLIIFLSISTIASAKDCSLNIRGSYFQDLDGDVQLLPKIKSYKTIYPKYKKFVPDYPINAALRIPIEGNCKALKLLDIKIYTAIGRNTFESSNDDHENHGSHWSSHEDFEKFSWQEKPIFSGKKEMKMERGLASIRTFRINDLSKMKPKGKHNWRYKFVIRFKKTNGEIEVFEKIINSPLIH